MQQHRRVERLAEFGSDGDVVVVAVRAHHRHHVAATDGLHDRFGVVGGVEHHDLGVVADEPDVVVDFPTAAVEFEGAVGDDAFDVDHYSTTTERSTLPSCILWNASSMSPSPMRSETNLLQRKPALQVQVDQGGEVAFGQAIAVPRRLQRAAVREEVHQRHVQAHVGRRNANQDNGSGEIARVERLLPGFRAADGVDHHVGAEPVGEVLDGLDDVEFARVDGVGGAELAGPVQLRVVGVDRDDPLGADQRGAGDRGVAHAAAADHRDGVVAGDARRC